MSRREVTPRLRLSTTLYCQWSPRTYCGASIPPTTGVVLAHAVSSRLPHRPIHAKDCLAAEVVFIDGSRVESHAGEQRRSDRYSRREVPREMSVAAVGDRSLARG